MKNIIWLTLLLLFCLLAGCTFPSNEITPTVARLNSTQANQTVIARVTEVALITAAAQSTAGESTATQEATASATDSQPTNSPVPPTARPTTTPQPCDRATEGEPIDVTIPDDTEIVAGGAFTKTWRLINTGTCTWTTSYAVVWNSEAQLGVEDVVFLTGSVNPNQTVDISVPMIAPTESGSYQSNWILRNAAGVIFGIGDGSGVFWARIEVVQPTPTPTPKATTTATATSTPAIQASGTTPLNLDQNLNLDNGVVNDSSGNDLVYQEDGSGNHLLVPQAGAQLGVFGLSQPGLGACQSASLGGAGVAVESLQIGSYLCVKTSDGRYARLQFNTLNTGDFSINVGFITWAAP